MGLYSPAFVSELKSKRILWFATATTVIEAKLAEAAGADVIVAQGMEAGGHRGAFHADEAERQMVGLIALLPQVVDAVNVPVIATGGIADARGVTAALILGAERSTDRDWFPKISGSDGTSSLCRRDRKDGIPRHYDYPRIHWSARTCRRNRVHSCLGCIECPSTGFISCPTWTHSRDAGRRPEGRGRRQNANVGWPGRQASSS